MPQNRKPPRLWLRTETRAGRKTCSFWVIKDGDRNIRTGCLAREIEGAQRKLTEYLAGQYEAPRESRSVKVKLADVLHVYMTAKYDEHPAPSDTLQIIGRLNDFFGDKVVADIKGQLCRDYKKHRGTAAGARRDLEILRAAVRFYHKENGLDTLPLFTLPDKSLPRDRYLARSEAAALLWAALGWERKGEKWIRRRDQKRYHLARMILIGIYTGTRPGAILKLQRIRSTTGGYADLNSGVIYRRADGERVAHNKRKTPVKIAPRLLAHLRRWERLDQGIRFIVHYRGTGPVTKINKAFRSARVAAGLGPDVAGPHVFRHTRATWLIQSGKVSIEEAAASLGLTKEEFERTYLHNDPNFQKNAATAY
jgi:integrase